MINKKQYIEKALNIDVVCDFSLVSTNIYKNHVRYKAYHSGYGGFLIVGQTSNIAPKFSFKSLSLYCIINR